MRELWDSGHITNVSYDRALPVHVAWDLGQADLMALWFFQVSRSGDINLIDYFQKRDISLSQLVAILQQKGYSYGTHIWPFDANQRDRAGITFASQARTLGLNGIVLENHSLNDGINLVKSTLGKCWFDKTKCKDGIIALENYGKKWNNSIGGWTGDPAHNIFSHGSDSFRYLCSGYQKVSGIGKTMESQYAAVRGYWGDG
jgi:hypothetical protein